MTDAFALLASMVQILRSQPTAWTDQGPYRRAATRLQSSFPEMGSGLPKTVLALLSDERAIEALGKMSAGSVSQRETDVLVQRFVDLTSIPDPRREDVEKWLVHFIDSLRQEFFQPGTPQWSIIEFVRHQHDQTRLEIRDFREEMRAATSPIGSATGIAKSADIGELHFGTTQDDADPVWQLRLEPIHELFRCGDFASARIQYCQTLDALTAEDSVIPRRCYHLHLNVASCHISLGQVDDAEASVTAALRYRPDGNRATAMLAQLHEIRGDAEAASAMAERVLARSPEQRDAWIVLIRTSPDITKLDDIPISLHEDAGVLLTLGGRLADLGLLHDALDQVKSACPHIAGSARQSVLAAELLLYIGLRLGADRMPEEDRALVSGLIETAVTATRQVARSRVTAWALAARSTLRLAEGDESGALADAKDACAADPRCTEALFAHARALGHLGRPDEGLFVLSQTESSSDPDILGLRVLLLADAGRPTADVVESIECALSSLRSSDLDHQAQLLALGSVATGIGAVDLAKQILKQMDDAAPGYFVNCLRARLRRISGDVEGACSLYDEALAAAPPQYQISLAREYSIYALERGQYDNVIQIIETVGLEEATETVYRVYLSALSETNRWDRIAQIIESQKRKEGVCPDWVLEASASLALQRYDFDGAVKYLEELGGRDSADRTMTQIRLAHALFRKGDVRASLEIVDRLLHDREGVEGKYRLSLAQLLFLSRNYDRAIRVAYKSLRDLWPSTEGDLAYISLFLASPEDLPCKASQRTAGPCCHVKLRNAVGDEVVYWILGDNMEPRSPDEFRSTSEAARQVIGRTVGESVILRPHDLDAMSYDIVEVKLIWVQAFQDALRRMTTQVAVEPSPIQAIRAGDDDVLRMLSTMTSTLHQRRERFQELGKVYSMGKMALSTLAIHMDISFRDAYHFAATTERGLLVEAGTFSSLRSSTEAALSADAVVLHASALITLHELGLLEILPRMVNDIYVPSAVVLELREDMEKAQTYHQSATGWIALEGDDMVVSQLEPGVVDDHIAQLEAMSRWLSDNATAKGCPPEAMNPEGEKLRRILGAASFDAQALATREVPLYADDLVLRALVAGERNGRSFSTFALLDAATALGKISESDFALAVEKLMVFNHRFLPMSDKLLYAWIKTGGYELTATVRRGLTRLIGGDVDTGAAVLGALVRQLAVAPLGGGILTAVVKYCAALLGEKKTDRREALRKYRAHVRLALRLHPLVLDDVDRILASCG